MNDEMTPAGGSLRPRAKRVSLSSMVLVRTLSMDRVFRARDVSSTGCFLFTKITAGTDLDVGAPVQLQLSGVVGGVAVAVRCTGVIARHATPGTVEHDEFPTGVGVRITACDPANSELLEQLLALGTN